MSTDTVAANTAAAASDSVTLTAREVEVLSLVRDGERSKQIADELGISKRTVDFHLNNVYVKLGVHGRIQAIREATRRNLLPKEID